MHITLTLTLTLTIYSVIGVACFSHVLLSLFPIHPHLPLSHPLKFPTTVTPTHSVGTSNPTLPLNGGSVTIAAGGMASTTGAAGGSVSISAGEWQWQWQWLWQWL